MITHKTRWLLVGLLSLVVLSSHVWAGAPEILLFQADEVFP